MGNAIAILAIVGLLVFCAYAVTASMDSAAYSWAEGQKAQAYATVAVAQIQADTRIELQQLQMLDNAYARALAAAFFWPVLAVAGLALAVQVWLQVWLASRRPLPPQQQQLPGNSWRPALPAPRDRDEWDAMPQKWEIEVHR